MACMDYRCRCGWFGVGNHLAVVCPDCGETVRGTFDEPENDGPDMEDDDQ